MPAMSLFHKKGERIFHSLGQSIYQLYIETRYLDVTIQEIELDPEHRMNVGRETTRPSARSQRRYSILHVGIALRA